MTAPSPMPRKPTLHVEVGCLDPACKWHCVKWGSRCVATFETEQQARHWIDQHKEKSS